MEPSLEQFLLLSEDEKIRVLKENNIFIHPLLWMMLSDSLKNSINLIYWVMVDKTQTDPPRTTITYEDGQKIIGKCDQLKASLTKIHNELVPKKEDQLHG
jgi:hypothetical protein